MVNVIAIPYSSFREKIRIMKENSNIKFSDIDGVLMHYEFVNDEESAFSLCRKERYCTVAESLEQSFKEMKLMREGKLPKKTWREYRAEELDK